jgi:hypothetical protein
MGEVPGLESRLPADRDSIGKEAFLIVELSEIISHIFKHMVSVSCLFQWK